LIRYTAELINIFDGESHYETFDAEDIDQAIEQAVDEFQGAEFRVRFISDSNGHFVDVFDNGSDRYAVHECRVLLRVEHEQFLEEEIFAITLAMAIDLTDLMWPQAETIAIETGSSRYRLSGTALTSLPNRWKWLIRP